MIRVSSFAGLVVIDADFEPDSNERGPDSMLHRALIFGVVDDLLEFLSDNPEIQNLL